MFPFASTCVVLFGCYANYRATRLYSTYTMLHRGTLLRLQVGVKARYWSYICVIAWAVAAVTEKTCDHTFSSLMSIVNCGIDIMLIKMRDFDDLDPFGSGVKKKLKKAAEKAKAALTPSNSGRSLAPMPI